MNQLKFIIQVRRSIPVQRVLEDLIRLFNQSCYPYENHEINYTQEGVSFTINTKVSSGPITPLEDSVNMYLRSNPYHFKWLVEKALERANGH